MCEKRQERMKAKKKRERVSKRESDSERNEMRREGKERKKEIKRNGSGIISYEGIPIFTLLIITLLFHKFNF